MTKRDDFRLQGGDEKRAHRGSHHDLSQIIGTSAFLDRTEFSVPQVLVGSQAGLALFDEHNIYQTVALLQSFNPASGCGSETTIRQPTASQPRNPCRRLES